MWKKVRVSPFSTLHKYVIALICMYTRYEIERLKLAFNWNFFYFLLVRITSSRAARSFVFLRVFIRTRRIYNITIHFETACAKSLIRFRFPLSASKTLYPSLPHYTSFLFNPSFPRYRCLSSSRECTGVKYCGEYQRPLFHPPLTHTRV